MDDAGGDEQHVARLERVARPTIDEPAPALRYQIDLVARVRLLRDPCDAGQKA